MPQVLLIRHCESTGQAPDAPLTEKGRAQALKLAAWLADHPIDHIISSPYLRARESIAPFAQGAHLAIDIDERLAERRLSPNPTALWREVVRMSFHDPDHRVPGGESGREAVVRGWAALKAALEGSRRLPALVTHGQLMSLLFHAIDSSFGFSDWESLTFPDVYLIEGDEGRPYRFMRAWV